MASAATPTIRLLCPDFFSYKRSTTREVQIDVSQDRGRCVYDRSRPFYVTGTEYEFKVPFDGDKEIFLLTPYKYSSNPPRAQVLDGELRIGVQGISLEQDTIRREFDSQLNSIKRYLEWASGEVESFNKDLREEALGLCNRRKEKLLRDLHVVECLGFPVHRHEGPSAVNVGMRKKLMLPKVSKGGGLGFVPEPSIADEAYHDILLSLRNMALTMERSPSTFQRIDEEAIRDFFLVALNAAFECEATAETFNYAGKTDILIRHDGRNLFIGECKFWSGPEAFMKTIDQLLGYAHWRDCKLAILLFNRNKDFSSVLKKIGSSSVQHPRFVRRLPYGDESCLRFVVRHPVDELRELTVTVLAFDIPSGE